MNNEQKSTPLENVMNIVRNLQEDVPVNNVSSGDLLTFQGNQIISLESAVTAGIATGDSIQFKRKTGGYDRIIYGISTDTSQDFDGVSTKYRTSGGGWVGVTTYTDCDGNFRVKSEILVAIGGNSGIETGAYGIAYPTPK